MGLTMGPKKISYILQKEGIKIQRVIFVLNVVEIWKPSGKRDLFVKANEKNGEKIVVSYENIFCDAAVSKRTCLAHNLTPYKALHRGIDSELEMLEKIAKFRWESLFTNENMKRN